MALTAAVIAPPEVAVPVPDATRFGAPPVPAASPLTGDDVQDILVTLPRGEGGSTSFPDLTLSYATAAKDLTARVAQSCDSVYVLAGNPGLMTLQAALRGTGRPAAPGAMLTPVPGRGEPLYLDEERSPRRHRLITAFEAYLKDKAVKLRADGWVQDVDAEGGFVAAAVDLQALVGVAGQGAFDSAGAQPQAAVGHQVVQDAAADGAGQVDHGGGDDVGGLDDLVSGGFESDGEAGPVRVGAGGRVDGVGDRDPDDLIDRQ
jgi:hypothetical protein